ncbi:MAG: protein kinase, partial [Deltaproteobacteria bacterium]|nr:protein kinase [Deltaproteobacteria bacterium]
MTSLPSPGQRLGRYRLEHRLGRGAMGMVFLARDTLLNIQVALKFINPAEAERELLERFKREVLLARQVTHPGICRIYDIHEESGHLFISMEYVEGRTLLSLLHERHTLPVAQATEIVRNVCRAVGAAHQHGVIHRDLKPSNIIVRGRCRISVLDFGLAKSAQLEQITGIGARVGTVAYMAPEVLAGEPSSVASDIYSTGVMLYESVAGQLPFPCTDLVALLYQVAHNRLLPVSQFNPNVAPSLEHAIERALAVKPERRFKTIDELQKALNAVLAELPEDAEGGAASGPWHGDVDESIQEALLDKRASGVLQAATSHTTVLFSDMVDIAPFFEKYGESTGVRRIQLHNRLLRPIVDKHRGKVIKCIGDAIMASFEGADDGVAAAIQMQYRLAAHNHTVTQPDDRIFVRIGLHSPATAISSSGAFGDAINVAAQASSLAGSEQVLISAATRDAMRAHRELTRLYGEVETRGGGGRHELYELLWRNATPPQGVDRDPGNPFDSPPVSATEKIDIAAARLAMPTDLAPSLPPTEQTEKYEIPDSPPEVEPCSEQTEKYAATPPAPGVEPPPQPAASQTARPPDTEAPRINIETPFDLVATVPTDDALDGVIRPAMVPVGRPPLRPTESTMPHREALAAHERSAAAHRADTPMATGESSAMALIGEDTTTATGEDTADAEAGNRWWLLGGACIAIAGAVGAWWFLTHRELERPVIGS